ncbi:MAG: phosphoribosylformylglycinamidine synthase subunit PurS [Chitinophagales bacterium]
MEFKAEINIMPLKELLDPKGKAVTASMQNLDLHEIKDVRIGKHIHLLIDADNEEQARTAADTACRKLLANPIMESYTFKVYPV